jgi:hypothetical protein
VFVSGEGVQDQRLTGEQMQMKQARVGAGGGSLRIPTNSMSLLHLANLHLPNTLLRPCRPAPGPLHRPTNGARSRTLQPPPVPPSCSSRWPPSRQHGRSWQHSRRPRNVKHGGPPSAPKRTMTWVG